MTTMVFESDGFFRRSEFFKQTKESIKKQGREATGDPNILLVYEMTAEEYEEFTS